MMAASIANQPRTIHGHIAARIYRSRTIIVLICWLLGYAGLIYGAGAFAAVYMVDHGADAHFVFRTIAAAYAVVFVAFQINARISEWIERRDVLSSAALLFAAAMVVMYLVPNLWVIAAAYIVGRVGTGIWLFNLYNYTAVAYPTRIRAVAFVWTDGLGHLGAWGGVTLLGPL
jgi:MFS family permease